jgi:hypothetical protein
MWKNNLTLPLLSLVLAALGALWLAIDFALQGPAASSPSASASAPTGGSPVIDGRIGEGEYARRFRDEATGIDLYWTVLGDQIYFALQSPSAGWVALSLSPEGPMMQGGDIIIGYVSDDGLHIQDNYADGPAGHQADLELGGQEDILEAAGSEGGEGTIIEFRRRLDTGDRYDRPIIQGEEEIQLAYSDSDDLSAYHARNRSTIMLNLREE